MGRRFQVLRSWMFLDPDLAFRGLFEFPNRGNLLQLVDAPLTGFKSVSTVLRADDDQDDIFTDVIVPYR